MDDNADREPEYWVWGQGPDMNESEPFALVPVKQDGEDAVSTISYISDITYRIGSKNATKH